MLHSRMIVEPMSKSMISLLILSFLILQWCNCIVQYQVLKRPYLNLILESNAKII